jgi:hypothetical protein
MRPAVLIWLFFRGLRWLVWLAAVGYYVEFFIHRPSHLNSFGHLLRTTEFWMFFLPVAGVFIGYCELMMRERANIPRPDFGRNWSPVSGRP